MNNDMFVARGLICLSGAMEEREKWEFSRLKHVILI